MIKKFLKLHSFHYIPARKIVIYCLDHCLKLILEHDMHSNGPLIKIMINNVTDSVIMF